MSGWRPALRIARRSMRRHRGRSILIAALIGVPIAGATVMNGLIETAAGPEQTAYHNMGNADGSVEVTKFSSLPGWTPGGYPDETGKGDRDPDSVDLARLLPDGSRFVPDRASGALRLTQGDRVVRTQLNMVAVGDALTGHQARLVSGRLPRSPSEALVTEPLAERLRLLDGDELRAGATITAEGGPTVTVTGLAVNPMAIHNQDVVASPNSVLRTAPSFTDEFGDLEVRRYLVDLPAGADPDAVWPALAEKGVTFTPRGIYTDPGRYPRSYVFDDPLETLGPIAAVVGFGLLEVVLLAGAAFAVGARRQVRELGLVAANGGTAKHVRRTVLAQGLALGLTGAVGGLLFGGLVMVAGWSVWEWLFGQVIDRWRVDWVVLAVAGTVGLLSGLAAALLPAISAARMKPADALAQRFRTTSLGTRLPLLGVVLLAVGVTGVLVAGVLTRRESAAAAALEGSPDYVPPDLTVPTIGVLGAGLLAVVGIIMITPGLVATLARVGGRLPLSGRLALRDAGRHRHRTVPAIAAIMIVVAGSVTLAFSFSAIAAGETKTQPDNTLMVRTDPSLAYPDDSVSGERVDEARRELAVGAHAAAAKLPDSSTVDVPMLEDASGSQVMLHSVGINCTVSQVGVASPELLALALGRPPDAGLRTALDEGSAVVLDECAIRDGVARTTPFEDGVEPVTLPAHYAARPEGTSYYELPGAFVSPKVAAEHGWRGGVDMVAMTYSPTASQDDIDAALTTAEDHGLESYQHEDDVAFTNLLNLALAGGAGLVTLLGVGITIALSAAESRADLATLAAIGARPRRRRVLAGAQAFVLSGLGTVLGVGLGGVLGFAMGALSGETAFAVPWQNLAITVVAVPLLAVGVAIVLTRSRLPMVRRVD
jgi:putative ABC transport system permease protein